MNSSICRNFESMSGKRSIWARGRLFSVLSRIALVSIWLLATASTCHVSSRISANAFCCLDRPLRAVPATKSSALGAFNRPDWMRRAGRIEEKRKQRQSMYESLYKRQDELGISRTMPAGKTISDEKTAPQRYQVVSPNNSNSTTATGDNDEGLAIYLFIPESEDEFNDESNIMDRLYDGEIVTSVQKKTVAKDPKNYKEPSANLLAASIIYNVELPPSLQKDIVWIEHDRGGWSPSTVDNEMRLKLISDTDEQSQ